MSKIKRAKTKIVATLGPSTDEEGIVEQLIMAGATMFRINTSHQSAEIHAKRIASVREASKKLKNFNPVLVDLQGPKIRVGNLLEPVSLQEGQILVLEAALDQTDKSIIPVDYKGIANDVKSGDKILLDDGKIELEVIKVEGTKVTAKVVYGELLKSRKGLNLPGSTASLDAVTERDVEFIKFAIEQNADYIALSFVREASDILLAKKYIKEFGGFIPVIAKIEKPQAVENLDAIMDAADGIMVARGDLGIEMSPEEVPIAQKIIIDKAIRARKVCIVATQMLESMMEEPIPTRAEASDVANAILDGTDAVMLSGETASGKHPVEAVKMMRTIADRVENCDFCLSNLDLEINDKYEISPQAIANAAVKMAQDLHAKAILAFTHTGYTPRLLAKLRPSVPLIAISDLETTCRRLNLFWDIYAFQKDWDTVLNAELLNKIDEYIYENTEFKKDERIIIVGSIPKLITGRTNFIRVHRIGAPTER
ncbi:MAG: pyruvate kinase [Candidatus Gastranaerophilales bacterium]|nr:pyruvate kinase [Candidatus Gastranaerophilales bacterium]